MINIDGVKPTPKALLADLEVFENFCMGNANLSPQDFRDINNELSIGAVLMIGKRRFKSTSEGREIYWQGLDGEEHFLGHTHDAKINRDYPGFHKLRSHALSGDMVESDSIHKIANGRRGNYTVVTLKDGTEGIGPNYNIALRNAVLKNHLTVQFNKASLFTYLSGLWVRA